MGWKCQHCDITPFGDTNCIAASEMGDFLGKQDLVSDNPACTSEPRDSWICFFNG